MKWFKHDSDANRDAKLMKVRIKYGMEGYGLYWFCIELIAGEVNRKKITFELEHDAEVIAHETGLHYEVVQEMINFMVDLGLFENDHGIITCMKIAKRLDQSMTSNPEMRLIIEKLTNDYHDGVMTKSCKTRLDKNRIEKKKKKRVPFKKPTTEQIQNYIDEKALSVNAEKFYYFYEAKDWMIGKNKMVNWKAALQNWHKKHWEEPYAKTDKRTRAKRVSDRLDEIAREDIEKNGVTEFLD